VFTSTRIKLAIFDWAGTTVDFGCLAPTRAFLEAFARHNIMLTVPQVRGPMGLHKYDHVRTLLEMPAVSEQWQFVHGRPWNEADAMTIYGEVTPLQVEAVRQHTQLVPDLLDCIAELRSREIRIGSTTGYPREAAEVMFAAAHEQGYLPDCCLTADDTPAVRPAPWMIFRIMQELDVFPPSSVVKIGDTVPDIEEGRNAGAWSLGVIASGSEIGLSAEEWGALPDEQQRSRLETVGRKLLDAGAHYVIPTLKELPATIDHIEARQETGERP
jgi:phosphonoacetaldehyde hydrolase